MKISLTNLYGNRVIDDPDVINSKICNHDFTQTIRNLGIKTKPERLYREIGIMYSRDVILYVRTIDSRIFTNFGSSKINVTTYVRRDQIVSLTSDHFAYNWYRILFIEFLLARRLQNYLFRIIASRPLRRLKARKKIVIWNRSKQACEKILGNILYYMTY